MLQGPNRVEESRTAVLSSPGVAWFGFGCGVAISLELYDATRSFAGSIMRRIVRKGSGEEREQKPATRSQDAPVGPVIFAEENFAVARL